jgi:hypothetical protein
MDRNLLVEEREALLDTIDQRRALHELNTGCYCWEQALRKMDAEVDV